MDLLEIGMMGYGLLSLGIAIVVIAWPIEQERHHHSARPASRADQGSGGNGNSLSGAAAARTFHSGSERRAR